MDAELPAARVSVLQEPGDQLLLTEELQGLDLQQTTAWLEPQNQNHRPEATLAVLSYKVITRRKNCSSQRLKNKL